MVLIVGEAPGWLMTTSLEVREAGACAAGGYVIASPAEVDIATNS